MASNHELTSTEKVLSLEASKALGFSVIVYQDGDWICQPKDNKLLGFGSSPDAAIRDCNIRNKSK